ncbi:ABC transporter transmembrane domain-containing protein [Wolbachia endosymbiont of Ctenocephalides felis wCfeJ]|uniref:ABC transporter transmembrane domain-containing protein n=1 Tax=Wolbachia endosymbiont of Ctenocephalides felis wCfeJ TaxID=2732594 RepID=UPI001FE74CCD|nr:ABC transporter transmembrane domain-containing protein [Wolbachia endosymbiont of Ctenocephalides felis wCfeJ]WCR57621.1 MAG: hypothetical protein PG980_000093 [Wolbachia endosymbiont of Ctenocephalides felis wCfeJ]
MNDITTKQALSFILKMLRPFKWHTIFMCLASLIWAIGLSLDPYIVKIILDRITIVPSKNIFEYLATPATFYILMLFLISCINRLYDYFINIKLFPNLHKRINDSSFDTLLGQSYHYYQNNFAGNLASKVNRLVDNIPDVIRIIAEVFLNQFLSLVIAIYMLWTVNTDFAIVMIIWAVSFIVLSLSFLKKQINLSTTLSKYGSIITGKMVDVFSNILSVSLFARGHTERSSMCSASKKANLMEQKIGWVYLGIFCVYGFSYVIMQGVDLYFLTKGRWQGTITVGDFALVMGINTAIGSYL